MRVFPIVAVMYLLAALCPGWLHAKQVNDFAAKVAPAIFKVSIEDERSGTRISHGSGFMIGRRFVVTNFNVIVKHFHNPEKYRVSVASRSQEWRSELVLYDVINDLAILEVNNLPHVTLMPLRREPLNPGESIFALGFAQMFELSAIEGIYSSTLRSVSRQTIAFTGNLSEGMSGGPALDSEGRLLGINVAKTQKSQKLSFLVPLAALEQMIRNLNMGAHRELASVPGFNLISEQIRKNAAQVRSSLTDSAKTLKVGQYRVVDFAKLFQCEQADEKVTSKYEKVLVCKNTLTSSMGQNHPQIGLFYIVVSADELRSPLRSGSFTGALWSKFGTEVIDQARSENYTDPTPHCTSSQFNNRHQLFVVAHVCRDPQSKFDVGAISAQMALAPIGEKPLSISVYVSGYSKEDLAAMMALIADGVLWQS